VSAPTITAPRPRGRRPRASTVLAWGLGMLLAVIWIIPIYWMFVTSFKPIGEILGAGYYWLPLKPTLVNYVGVLAKPIGQWFLNSVVVAVCSTVLALLAGAMTGYALARLNFPGRDVLFVLVLAALMIPTEMTVVPLYIAFLKVHLVNSWLAMILPSIPNTFSVFLFRQFFLGLPRELEDAAAIDGCGHFRTFWMIGMPLARPAVVAAGIILFATSWNNFLWPLLVALRADAKTLPVGMADFAPGVGQSTQLESYGVAMAAMTILAIPSLAVFVVLQRQFIQGVTSVGIKG
jgi:multiple sugar transport system permease protein